MLSNELDSEPYVVEEEPIPWADHDTSRLAATRKDSYEGSHFADPLNQRPLSVIGANSNGEAHYYHPSHKPVRELVRAEDSGERHELNRFWRPRRQY